MKPVHAAIAFIVIAMALTTFLIAGSFVTYTDSVPAWRIQNIYISRIMWYGGTILALLTSAIALLVVAAKSQK